ncbi:MAG: hypothetical protein QG660_486 [Pseudomonadota bacterium]|nr:hypothetical protein [Pseudomonadota bacterium]
MRRQLVGKAAGATAGNGLYLPLQVAQLPLQRLDLLLLSKHRAVQRFQHILGVRELDFQFVDACFHN